MTESVPFAVLKAGTRCAHCQRLVVRLDVDGQPTCGQWSCRRNQLKQQRALQKKQLDAQAYTEAVARAAAERQRLAAENRRADGDSYRIVLLPANTRRLRPLARRRRYRFVKRLIRLVARIESTPPSTSFAEPHASTPAGLQVLQTACETCRGACCLRGGTLAHLNEETLQRWARQSGRAARELIESYARHFPEDAYEGSCVFHGSAGCALPPEMRADACHAYACGGWIELRNASTLRGENRFFIASDSHQQLHRARFCDVVSPDNSTESSAKSATISQAGR